MNNVLLGKTLKAMYKMSGKTLGQLSDETGVTVDTINNLFYARIQKPGLTGVNALACAMGFSIQQLMTFLEENEDLPEDCDVTELFAKYISSAADTDVPEKNTKEPVRNTKGSLAAEIELIQAEHERQLDRFRATHQRYVEQLKEQYTGQIEQMQAHNRQMEQHFDRSVAELKALHAGERERLSQENMRLRRIERILALAVVVETGVVLMILIVDLVNHSVGWLR